MELLVSGKLMIATSVQPSFTGCRIEAVFDRKPAPAPSALSTSRPTRAELLEDAALTPIEPYLNFAPDLVAASAVAPTSIEAPIPFKVSALALSDAAGNFTLVFPELKEIASEKVKIVVYSPVGKNIREMELIAAGLGAFITIEVQEFGGTTLDKPVEPTEQATRRIRGRVIERSGKQLPPSLQVLLLGHEQDTEDGESLAPILVAKADSSGYFSGAIRNVKFDRVVAVVSGIPGDIPVRLVDSLVPPHIPIIIELPNTPAGPSSKDCNCSNSAVPRTPTQYDIAETPGAFSADLGTGQCIRFNVPNRAIEEFNFYSVVRTTEPHIVGITVGALRDKPATAPSAPPPTGAVTLPPPPPTHEHATGSPDYGCPD